MKLSLCLFSTILHSPAFAVEKVETGYSSQDNTMHLNVLTKEHSDILAQKFDTLCKPSEEALKAYILSEKFAAQLSQAGLPQKPEKIRQFQVRVQKSYEEWKQTCRESIEKQFSSQKIPLKAGAQYQYKGPYEAPTNISWKKPKVDTVYDENKYVGLTGAKLNLDFLSLTLKNDLFESFGLKYSEATLAKLQFLEQIHLQMSYSGLNAKFMLGDANITSTKPLANSQLLVNYTFNSVIDYSVKQASITLKLPNQDKPIVTTIKAFYSLPKSKKIGSSAILKPEFSIK